MYRSDPMWKKLLPYLKGYQGDFWAATSSMAVVALLSTVSMGMIKLIIDQALIERDLRMLKDLAILMPTLFLIKSAFSYILNYKMAKLGHAVAKRLRMQLTEKLLHLDHLYHSQKSSSDHLMRATSDVANVANMVSNAPLYVIRDGLTVIFLLALVLVLNARFALGIFLTIPVFAGLFLLFTNKLRRITKTAQELVAQLYQMISEGLSGLTLIKIYLYENPWMRRFGLSNDAHYNAMLKFQRTTALAPSLMEFLSGLIISFVLFWGGFEVIQGTWSAGDFMAFLGAAFAAYQPVKHLSQVNPIIQMGLTSYRRILDIQDTPIKIELGAESLDNTQALVLREGIRFENVGLVYPDGRRGLDHINCLIKKGEALGIAGASGSGKTTLAMLLARLYDPTEGIITFDNSDLKNLNLVSLRKNIAFVTQEAFLFADTIYANIAMGNLQATKLEIEEAARLAHISEFLKRLPQGLQTEVGERGARLSAGQKQRIAIARAIVKKAQLLILDEATSNLDPESEEFVLDALRQLLKDKTSIVISHRIQALADTSRILVMDRGKIIEETSFDELQKGGAEHLERLMRLA